MKVTKREMLEEILLNQKAIMSAQLQSLDVMSDAAGYNRIRISKTKEIISLSRTWEN